MGSFFLRRRRQQRLFQIIGAGWLFFSALLNGPYASAVEPLGSNPEPLWLRYPAISPDGKTIAFAFEGHLFLVSADGGVAQPLTAGPAHDTSPVWSADGKSIAFASDRYGHYDIYVTSIEGGQARRLTTYSTDAIPSAFTPDGKFVLFGAHRRISAQTSRFPTSRLPELYKVAIEGGREPEMVLTTPALNAQFDRVGQRLLYDDQKGYENLWRKHTTSAFAHDIWLFDVRSGNHTKLTTYAGEDRNAVWAPDQSSLFYLSEQSGSFNVWNLTLKDGQPGTPRQITHFERNPVRFLSGSNGGDLCFGFDGQIYLLRSNSDSPKKVPTRIAVAETGPVERITQMSDGVTEMTLSPTGKEIAFVVRGDVYVASIEHGDTKRITNTSGQERNLCFSPDGRKLLFAYEQNGPWSLYEASIAQPKEKEPYFFNSTVVEIHPILENDQENFSPKYSPDGKEVAYLENRTTLKVLNLDSKETRTILAADRNYSYTDGDQWFDWAPDGKYFLVTFLQEGRYSREVGLVTADGKQTLTNLTQSGYDSGHPFWAQNGKSMLWFTDRYGLHGDGNGSGRQLDLLEMFFTQDAFDRFNLSPAEYDILKAKEEEEKKKKEGDKQTKEGAKDQPSPTPETTPKVEPLSIDLKDIEDRTARLTLASTRLADAEISSDGEQLVYLARSDKGFDLWSLKPRQKELKRLAQLEATETEGIGFNFPQGVELDKESKNAFVLVNGRINKVELASGKMEPVKFSAEKQIDAAKERAYFFEHMWRQMKEKFYDANMNGVDWNYYKQVYARFLPYIADNRDFAEMMSELLGELNSSHTGCRYYAHGSDQTASLGAFFDQSYQGPGLKIEEPIEKGPLFKAGVEIQPGMIIEKIDGTPFAVGIDISPLLNFKAGKPTLLSIFDPAKNIRFDVRIKPISLAAEDELLYERWVKKRRELVDKLSGGTIAYVHVRNMTDSSYRDVFSQALGRGVTKKALIVDTRFNPGGNLHDQLATFLEGQPYLKRMPRGQFIGWAPDQKWQRPSAVLGCEGNYSDGMLFPWLYKHFQIGKVVGMPIPGTGTAVWWEFQQDPTLMFGIPEVAMFDADGNLMEKAQVEPNIEVMNDPKSVAEGRDLQIERAIAELMKESRR